MKKSIMERIESVTGNVTAYDWRLVIWTTTGSHDLRDILGKVRGVTLADAQDALEEADAQASKDRKAAIKAAKENL